MKQNEIDRAIVAKIRAKALKEIDTKLRKCIEEGGPMLLWSGNGEFPGGSSRGLSIGRIRLSEWLNVK